MTKIERAMDEALDLICHECRKDSFEPKKEDCTVKGCPMLKSDDRPIKIRVHEYCLFCCLSNPTEIVKCPSTECPIHPYR